MKRNYVLAAIVSVVGMLCSISVFAQDSKIAAAAGDKYVISAKAGGVNFVTGAVSVAKKEGKSGLLLAGDELDTGDRVTTGVDGKAEILLNPGSFLRVGSGSSFEFVSTSLDDLKIKLLAGSAVLEVIAADDFRVSVEMPRSLVVLSRSGVFRLDIQEDGSSKLAVFKGKVPYGPEGKNELKSGRSVVLGGNASIEVSKFDTDARDDLDIWSRDRAKELTKLNARLENKNLRNMLTNSYNQRGWNVYNSFGLWVFDASRRSWCFLPFGSGWGSPYGWGYYWDIWNLGLPYSVFRDPRSGWGNGNGNGSGNGNGGPLTGGGTGNGSGNPKISANPSNSDRRGQMQLPPFQRIQNGAGGGQDVVVRRRPPVDVDSSPSAPMRSPVMLPPSTPASAPASAPASVPVVVDSKKRDN